jgi:hypothetical protein
MRPPAGEQGAVCDRTAERAFSPRLATPSPPQSRKRPRAARRHRATPATATPHTTAAARPVVSSGEPCERKQLLARPSPQDKGITPHVGKPAMPPRRASIARRLHAPARAMRPPVPRTTTARPRPRSYQAKR